MPYSTEAIEYAQLLGIMSGLMAYGIHFTLFVMTAYLLIMRRNTMRRAYFYLAYICLQFSLSSVGLWRDVVSEAVAYVAHADSPGGPVDYYNIGFSSPPEVLSVSAYAICTWLQDGLLLYRCLLFYSARRSVVILPGMLFAASVAMSLVFIVKVSRSGDLYDAGSIDLGIPYWSLSISFNLVVTLLIVGRLYSIRKQVEESLTPDIASIYTSVGAMLVESAALYSVTGLIFIACYDRNNPAQYAFITWLGQVESISPLLIIMRVAQDRAWSKGTIAAQNAVGTGTLRFRVPAPCASHHTTSESTGIRLEHIHSPSEAGVARTIDTVRANSPIFLSTEDGERVDSVDMGDDKWHKLAVKQHPV